MSEDQRIRSERAHIYNENQMLAREAENLELQVRIAKAKQELEDIQRQNENKDR